MNVKVLRNLSKSCNFCKCMNDSEIWDQIVLGIGDNTTRKQLLQEWNLDLKHYIDIFRLTESTNAQLGESSESFSISMQGWKHQRPKPEENQEHHRKLRADFVSPLMCFTTTSFPLREKDVVCVCGEKNHWRGSTVCNRKERAHAAEIESDDQDLDFEQVFTPSTFD